MKILIYFIPSLKGTLANHALPKLQPNFANKSFRPSRSETGLIVNVNLIEKWIENKAVSALRGIKHWGLIGYSNLLLRINFCVTGQESNMQPATTNTIVRWHSLSGHKLKYIVINKSLGISQKYFLDKHHLITLNINFNANLNSTISKECII